MKIPPNFTDRAFFIQHIVPYEYAKKFSKSKVVLDAGTSKGYGAFCLSEAAKLAVGLDIDPEAIKSSQEAYQKDNLKYVLSSVLDIQFPDRYFDVIISSQVVEHIALDKLDTYLSELARVLKDDGVIFINTLNVLHNLKGRKPEDPYDKCTQHVKEFKPEEFREFLKRRFPKVEVLGLRRNFRHQVFHLLKKSGLLKKLPDKINPLCDFYQNKI